MKGAATTCENCGDGVAAHPRLGLCNTCSRIALRSEILGAEIDQTLRVLAECREAAKLLVGEKTKRLTGACIVMSHDLYADEAAWLAAQRSAKRKHLELLKQWMRAGQRPPPVEGNRT